MQRRDFLKLMGGAVLAAAAGSACVAPRYRRPSQANVLLITGDDLNWDSVGAYGCPVAEATPNVDRLAQEGIRFEHAHVTVAICQPSRAAMLTGRYAHRSGGEGFRPLTEAGVPILPEELRQAGYRVGILGKVAHSTPYLGFPWDMAFDRRDLGQGRSPQLYYQYARAFIQEAADQGRPFFLMANSHDPHRPFYGNDRAAWYDPAAASPAELPSRTFSPEEVQTPPFLPDLPEVRLEVAEYHNSVRRMDDLVGLMLQALREAGAEERTLVVFLGDNGMSFPFAKSNCYRHSTPSSWILRWPGRIQPGSVDSLHIISGIDLMPTLLEMVGAALPAGMDGFSFVPLLEGQTQAGRDRVFTMYQVEHGGRPFPMRSIQTQQVGYLFSPWSNGERTFISESLHGRTFQAMLEAAKTDAQVAARVQLLMYRVVEEFYDYEADPGALHNLIDAPDRQDEIQQFRVELEAWMVRTGVPALEAFRHRDDPAALEAFVTQSAIAPE